MALVILDAPEVGRREALRRTISDFPWLPLVPAALVLGASLTALALALRANRRMTVMEDARAGEAAHEALHRQSLETIGP